MLQIDPTSAWLGLLVGLVTGVTSTALAFVVWMLRGYRDEIELLRLAAIPEELPWGDDEPDDDDSDELLFAEPPAKKA